MSITHSDLVVAGREWLRTKQKCSVIASEIKTMGMEEPDVIGWYGLGTHLIECKTSRSDFLADKKKPFRNPDCNMLGIGNFRWYLTTPNIIKSVDELPENFGWLEYNPIKHKIKILGKAIYFPTKAVNAETAILLSVIKRLGQQEPEGCSIRCYTYQTKNTSAVDISY